MNNILLKFYQISDFYFGVSFEDSSSFYPPLRSKKSIIYLLISKVFVFGPIKVLSFSGKILKGVDEDHHQ